MLRHFPRGRTARAKALVAVALSASLLTAVMVASPGVASDDRNALTHQKQTLTQRLASSHADVDQISKSLLDAQARLDAQSTALASAQQTLAVQRLQVSAAVARDELMQARLVRATQSLTAAEQQLVAGRHSIARQRARLVGYAVASAPAQIVQLSTLNLLFSGDSTQQIIGQAQASEDAANRQVTDFQRLQANLVLLRYTEQRVKQDVARVAVARRQAAANLAERQRLETQAQATADSVAAQVTSLQRQRNSLAAAKAAELARIHQMTVQRNQLEARLKRLAEQEAKARREHLAQSSTAAPTDGGYLSYPVHDTYITSPFGMRMNPVIHVYELHDGTDFHAVCGTPVYAAAPGTVMSEYWNDAYGNRLFINHGIVRGVGLVTSYNHLTSYVAHVGEHVDRGQLVAYSGTTGWSTGCHLHFSVYVNGVAVNPVTWL